MWLEPELMQLKSSGEPAIKTLDKRVLRTSSHYQEPCQPDATNSTAGWPQLPWRHVTLAAPAALASCI